MDAGGEVKGRRGRSDTGGERISSHTLRYSYARHLLVNRIPINYLSCWLGYSSIQTTLIYLELVPDPTGSLAAVP
ncbi:MAG: tyrosine-type recombinase/integrase [Dehalococcoidia bacterium]|nr:tyrosine-type recombinase/integrase [Dehalococcoidia bacterium]MXY22068.1 tyrosine-type recombinase/integrase [Dehalococcoidia bacterium]